MILAILYRHALGYVQYLRKCNVYLRLSDLIFRANARDFSYKRVGGCSCQGVRISDFYSFVVLSVRTVSPRMGP